MNRELEYLLNKANKNVLIYGFSLFEDVTSVSFLKCIFTIPSSTFILLSGI